MFDFDCNPLKRQQRPQLSNMGFKTCRKRRKTALRACQTSPEAKNILPKGNLKTPFKAGQNL